jgi:preprotein translocase subunit YajC
MYFLLSVFPILFIFLIFYFIVIRPQTKAESKRKEFINNLKKGEIVILSSGIIGKVIEVQPRTIVLEISKDVKIKVLKEAIQGPFVETQPQPQQQENKSQENRTKEEKK